MTSIANTIEFVCETGPLFPSNFSGTSVVPSQSVHSVDSRLCEEVGFDGFPPLPGFPGFSSLSGFSGLPGFPGFSSLSGFVLFVVVFAGSIANVVVVVGGVGEGVVGGGVGEGVVVVFAGSVVVGLVGFSQPSGLVGF